jgi:uncharacterized protein (DUF433 family)
MLKPAVADFGRGPQIVGTGITVYDVLDHSRHGWNAVSIACKFGISSPQVEAAIAYVESHPEVEIDYAQILESRRKGNSPEVRALLLRIRTEMDAKLFGSRPEERPV